jgi:hypothetical protein
VVAIITKVKLYQGYCFVKFSVSWSNKYVIITFIVAAGIIVVIIYVSECKQGIQRLAQGNR